MLNMKDLNVLLVYMSVSIPKPINEDWRTKLARDDAKQRKIRLKNIARDDKQAEILFKEKQQKLYNNVRDVFPTEKLETFIQDQSIISRDVKNNMETAKQRLRQVSTNDEVVDFILERLSEDELNYLLVNFNKVMTKLKKTNTKLDKELFIQFIRKEALDNPVTLGNVNENENIERRPLKTYLFNEEKELVNNDHKFIQKKKSNLTCYILDNERMIQFLHNQGIINLHGKCLINIHK